ncbi:hypothetical protein KJ359_009868 [Pestalotiopsis sp. 9143b]|nr:hypothetical protein KJ359_009868 [Pestalotiopsis sp. 9143b]
MAPTDILADLVTLMEGRQSLSITFSKTLKDRHPNFVISQVNKATLDFLGYAEAGNAEAAPDADSDYITSLSFSRETSSTDRNLKDKVLFAKYKYSWQDTDFFLFVLSPRDFREHDELHFLLTPRGTAVYHDGVHPKTKELAKAVGQWTAQTSKKTLDFNSKPWEHHNYLEAADWTWETMPSINWDDIIMEATAKTAMKEEATTFFASRELLKNFNLPWKRGIIFHGPSGTGKTTFMKALMTTLAEGQHLVPSVYANFASQHDVYPSKINDMFSRARQAAPCLLVLEDLDSFTSEDSRSTFLDELDTGNNDGILILGSTRNIQDLDPAIRDRPGRFDSKYYCKLPGHDERVTFAKQWKAKLDKYQLVTIPEEACDFIAKLTDGFSYTHLKELFSTLLFFQRNAPAEDEAVNSETASEEEKESNRLSIRQQALADIATPESLHDNRVVTFIRRQASVMLNEMEMSETASKKTRRHGSGRFVARREVSRGFAADENDSSEATSSRSFSRLDFPVITPSRSSMVILDNDEDACPGCTRHLKVPVKTENDPDACPGCTRRAAQAPISIDACPGCTRKAIDSSNEKEAEPSDVAATEDLDSPDACPGCTRKEKAAAAPDASEDACPGCTKKLAADNDVSEDACPECTRKLASTTSASAGGTDVSPDACPGCTRKLSEAAKVDGEQTDDASLKACPGCTKKTADAVKLLSEDSDVSPDACPGCTRKKASEAVQTSQEDADAGASTDACPGCTKIAAQTATASDNASDTPTDASTDACPGCTRKLADTATANEDDGDASTDACPGCTKNKTDDTAEATTASEDDGEAGTDACPGCTRKLATSTASLSIDDADVSPDACPGCTRKAAADAANSDKEATDASTEAPATATETEATTGNDDASTDACPGCTRKEAADKVSQASDQTDGTVGAEACPGCT